MRLILTIRRKSLAMDIISFALGLIIGWSTGFAVGRKQKPWSELSEGEKKSRIWLIALGVIALVAGIVVFFLVGS